MHRIALAFLALLLPAGALAGSGPAPDPGSPDAPAAATSVDDDDLAALPVRRVGEVVAVTNRAGRPNLETPGNITVIQRPQIEASGARDVPDLLRREAGVFVTNDTTSPEGYRIEARGFNNGGGNGSATLVLVDGRRVNEPDSSVADWALIDLDAVERIEVVRGPVNAAWGDNAQAGVINIITRSGEGPLRFEARGRYGSWDARAGSLFAGGSAGPVTAALFVDGQRSDNFRERALFRDHGGFLKLGFDLGDLARIDLKGGYSSDKRERPGTLSRMQIETLGRDAAEPSTDENFARSRVRYLDGGAQLFLAEQVTLRGNAWYRRRDDEGAIGTATTAFETLTETNQAGADTSLEVAVPVLGHANQLVVGGDWLREKVDSGSVFELLGFPPPSEGATRAERTTWGVFLQDDFHVLEDLILSGGVRYDRSLREGTDRVAGSEFEVEQSAWSPRAALTWNFVEPASVYASWAKGFRFPNLNEAFGFFGFAPELEPEKSTNWEVGAKWRSERADVNVAFYYLTVRNEIYFNPERGFPFGENVNLDRVRHKGVEFQAAVRPWAWLELYGSYTYDHVEITRDTLTMLEGARIPLVPRHRGNAGVRVFGPCHTELGMNGTFVGSRPFTNDVAGRFDRLDAWERWDVHVAWRPRIGEHVTLGVEANVYNVFDQEYSEVGGIRTFFDPMTFLPAQEQRFFPSPGRNFDVRVMVEVRR